MKYVFLMTVVLVLASCDSLQEAEGDTYLLDSAQVQVQREHGHEGETPHVVFIFNVDGSAVFTAAWANPPTSIEVGEWIDLDFGGASVPYGESSAVLKIEAVEGDTLYASEPFHVFRSSVAVGHRSIDGLRLQLSEPAPE